MHCFSNVLQIAGTFVTYIMTKVKLTHVYPMSLTKEWQVFVYFLGMSGIFSSPEPKAYQLSLKFSKALLLSSIGVRPQFLSISEASGPVVFKFYVGI